MSDRNSCKFLNFSPKPSAATKTFRHYFAICVGGCFLYLLSMTSSALSQESIFDLVIGRWWDKTTQTDVNISRNKRVSSSFWKGLTGSVVETSKSGSNFGFFNEERECYYFINVLGDGSRSNWKLVDESPKGVCPPGGDYEIIPEPEEILKKRREDEAARQALKEQSEALLAAQARARIAAEATAAAAEKARLAVEAKAKAEVQAQAAAEARAAANERARQAAAAKEQAEIEAQKAAEEKRRAELAALEAEKNKIRAAQDVRRREQKKNKEEELIIIEDEEETPIAQIREPIHKVKNLCTENLRIWFYYFDGKKWLYNSEFIPSGQELPLPNVSHNGPVRFKTPWYYYAEAGTHRFGSGYYFDIRGVRTPFGLYKFNDITFTC